jgi:hypothetical protein
MSDPSGPQEPRKGLSRGMIAFLIVLAVLIIGAGICVAIMSNIQY